MITSDDWTSLAHKDSKKPRYYCPACGMVRAVESWGVTQVLTKVSPARVIGHYRHTDVKAKELCPGGEIDLVKDRAP
jgi:hypothetical protein